MGPETDTVRDRHIRRALGWRSGRAKARYPTRLHSPDVGNAALEVGAKQSEVVSALEEIVRNDICPTMVGAVGAGSFEPDTLSGAWPVILPLAPYFESIAA